jgi:transcriptional regulator with PAS, ATPase and Fis domain
MAKQYDEDEALVDSLFGDEEPEESEDIVDEDEAYSELAKEHEEALEDEEDKMIEKKMRSMLKKQEEKWDAKMKSKELYAEFMNKADDFEKEFAELLDPTDPPKEMKHKIELIQKHAEKAREKFSEKEKQLQSQYGAPLDESDIKQRDEQITELLERTKKGDPTAALEVFLTFPTDDKFPE